MIRTFIKTSIESTVSPYFKTKSSMTFIFSLDKYNMPTLPAQVFESQEIVLVRHVAVIVYLLNSHGICWAEPHIDNVPRTVP